MLRLNHLIVAFLTSLCLSLSSCGFLFEKYKVTFCNETGFDFQNVELRAEQGGGVLYQTSFPQHACRKATVYSQAEGPLVLSANLDGEKVYMFLTGSYPGIFNSPKAQIVDRTVTKAAIYKYDESGMIAWLYPDADQVE